MARRKTCTSDQLRVAVATASSIRQVLAQLGLAEAGGNYASIREEISRLNLDCSHFLGHAWRSGSAQPVVAARSLDDLLQLGTKVQSYKLKNRLLAVGLNEWICEKCRQTEWLSQPIPLEMHHRNGDPNDNRLVNLELLCPNCHALTNTYRGRKLAKCRDETAPT